MENISIKIILARPRNPDNIGAAARAMANFGLSELALVAPHIPTWRETAQTAATAGSGEPIWLMERARAAVGAADIIRAAKIRDTLAEAAADCDLLLGTSALQRRTPDRDVIPLGGALEFLAERLPAGKKHKVGVLFGSERTGLTNEDLSHCHAALNIPTSEKQPSINLGQAVALVCYELAGQSSTVSPRAKRPEAAVPSVQEIERVVSEICALLDEKKVAGTGGENYESEIRRSVLDARLTKGAMGILKTLLRRARLPK
ncbi:MAG: RNA methyltransferase [Elusimicrobiota bacterium]